MQKIGIGYENYKDFIDDNLYYVDKTLLIRDILEKGGKVNLFTRPRRFGKTLALSTIRTFFELEYDRDGNIIDKQRYFDGKKIMQCDDSILSKMGRYPVIKLSLKSAKQLDFKTAFFKLREEIIYEFARHEYLLNSSILNEDEINSYKELRSGESIWQEKIRLIKDPDEREAAFKEEVGKYSTALKTLSMLLQKHHGENVIILLDEYDVPLENAYYSGFYDKMVGFIRSLFESALKTNDALELAVVTGCLRISKESIFTGLNNLEVNSIRNGGFEESFGFTQNEVTDMLEEYNLSDKYDIVKSWYDGYLFGNTEIYNPWSVIKYIKNQLDLPGSLAEPYWSNTSSNSIVKDMIKLSDDTAKEELDRLVNGGTIEKKIHEDITYDDVHANQDNLWNFLFFTGYMKKVSERAEGDDIYMTMCIPNREIRSIFRNQISLWFEDIVKQTDLNNFHNAVLNKDTETMENFISDLLERSISTFDCSESFYHGFLLSLLYGTPSYTPRSNRETGNGRADIVLYPNRPKDPAYIFEFKVRKKFNEMEAGLDNALEQIKEKKYAEGVLEDGYIGSVSYGICFCKKSCIVGLTE
ncbi:MAG: ATP-binding protein [Lachnospiraceae bacterium]|nr:ATP-binding protein [Lachnospiraceae bacterium]